MSAPLKTIEGTSDIAATMAGIGRRAKAAARVLALASTAQKDRRADRHGAGGPRGQGGHPRSQRRGHRRRQIIRRNVGVHRPAGARRQARCRDGRRHRSGARATRSGRQGHGILDAAKRHDHRARSRAARRHRGDLRKPSQRHGRRRRAGPQGRQRGDPARRLGRPPLGARHSCGARERLEGCRPAGGRDLAGADPRPRRGRSTAARTRRRHRCDRTARRQEPGRARADRGARAGVRASRRRLPCLRRQGGETRHGEDHRPQRQAAAHRRLRRGRDAAGRSRRRRDASQAADRDAARCRLRGPRRRRGAKDRRSG